MLDNADKAYYSQKLSMQQKEYEDLRRAFFQMEDNLSNTLLQDRQAANTVDVSCPFTIGRR
jgi:hypothetical protein